MAAAAILPYSSVNYETLPFIMDAARHFGTTAAAEALSGRIAELFVDHHVENEFGIVLLHNHFDMSPSEMLVEFGNASIPWDMTLNPLDWKNVAATSWRFTAHGVAPYEFRHIGPFEKVITQPSLERHGAFLAELADILAQYNLLDVLGLSVVENSDGDNPATLEFTSGRANITIRGNIGLTSKVEPAASIEAGWKFKEIQGMFCQNCGHMCLPAK